MQYTSVEVDEVKEKNNLPAIFLICGVVIAAVIITAVSPAKRKNKTKVI